MDNIREYMASYGGIGKEDILHSLKEAEKFLRHLNLGPATNRILAERLSEEVYAKLEAAYDDATLTGALYDLQWRDSPFVQNMLVFYYHAILDTDGIGKKVYDGLNAWGAFQATVHGKYPESQRERKVHITALQFNKAEELKNGHNIPHPAFDDRDFTDSGKMSFKKPPQP